MYPFKNEVIFIKNFTLALIDNQNVEILMLMEKQSFQKEKYLLSIIFQKSEKNFIVGKIFIKLNMPEFKKIYNANLMNSFYLFSKFSIFLCDLTHGQFKVKDFDYKYLI